MAGGALQLSIPRQLGKLAATTTRKQAQAATSSTTLSFSCQPFFSNHKHHQTTSRLASTTTTTTTGRRPIDLRSDTVTSPSRPMLEAALTAPTGDDVLGEDPTIQALQDYAAHLFFPNQHAKGAAAALFVPTGTMSNLAAVLAHCHGRASEIVIGAASHINLWEGGGPAGLGGVHTRQIPEDRLTGELDAEDVRDARRVDDDDHVARTELLCLENTHNMLGGIALSVDYMDRMGALATDELKIGLHVDGARIFNAAAGLDTSVATLCAAADTVSVCLSKGLGAPAGSLLVVKDNAELWRLAKRARKRLGGGMRQSGVLASMGLYALQHNVALLADDHHRAVRLGQALAAAGFDLLRNGKVDTNIVYFRLPPWSTVSIAEFGRQLREDWGVLVAGGYARGGALFRVVTHLDLTDEDVEYATRAMVEVACRKHP